LGFLIPQFYYIQNMCCLLLCFDRFAAIYSAARDCNVRASKRGSAPLGFLLIECLMKNNIRWAINGDIFVNDASKVSTMYYLPLAPYCRKIN
ncbi:hypothetical protein PMAYCL1PPCAC_27733, partial [Pristionchus mayeri]